MLRKDPKGLMRVIMGEENGRNGNIRLPFDEEDDETREKRQRKNKARNAKRKAKRAEASGSADDCAGA